MHDIAPLRRVPQADSQDIGKAERPGAGSKLDRARAGTAGPSLETQLDLPAIQVREQNTL